MHTWKKCCLCVWICLHSQIIKLIPKILDRELRVVTIHRTRFCRFYLLFQIVNRFIFAVKVVSFALLPSSLNNIMLVLSLVIIIQFWSFTLKSCSWRKPLWLSHVTSKKHYVVSFTIDVNIRVKYESLFLRVWTQNGNCGFDNLGLSLTKHR